MVPQAHLIRADDGHYYVAKFPNNPQNPRVLANEWLASSIARMVGLTRMPIEWHSDGKTLVALLDRLHARRTQVRTLIHAVRMSPRAPFNGTSQRSAATSDPWHLDREAMRQCRVPRPS